MNYDQNIQFTNAGYYNPVPPPSSTDTTDSGFVTNGFSTFMGSNLPFNLQVFFFLNILTKWLLFGLTDFRI